MAGRDSGKLVVVGTPIGNLGDLTLRAAEALKVARVVACEDTRRARSLLAHLGAGRGVELLRNDKETERGLADVLVSRMKRGEGVVLVSDSGMPGVSDPGAVLVAAARAAGLVVEIVGGVTAVAHAVCGSGFEGGYVFLGFIPRKGQERREVLARVAREALTCVIYEAPGRVAETVAALAEVCGEARRAWVARELTKLHEEWLGATLGEIGAALEGREVKGECVVVVKGLGARGAGHGEERIVDAEIVARLAKGEGVKDIASWVADVEGISRKEAYARVEGLKEVGTGKGMG